MGDYVVRLVMRVEADSPPKATQEFVTYLVEGGLVNWIFRVEDPETQEILGYFNGHGMAVDMDQIVADTEAMDEAMDDDDEPDELPTPVDTVDLPDVEAFATDLEITVTSSATPSDQELLTLAESLNETEQL